MKMDEWRDGWMDGGVDGGYIQAHKCIQVCRCMHICTYKAPMHTCAQGSPVHMTFMHVHMCAYISRPCANGQRSGSNP